MKKTKILWAFLGVVVLLSLLFAGQSITVIRLWDTNQSHYMDLVWYEDDAANRNLRLLVDGATRSLTLEGNAILDQDYSSDADIQHAAIYHTGFISTPYYNCGNSGASITIDWNNGNLQYVTLDNVGVDITFTEPPNSGRCELWIIQDGTGNRTIDWEHEISPKWPGDVEPTLSTAAGAIDVVVFTFIGGTTYRGLFNGDFR